MIEGVMGNEWHWHNRRHFFMSVSFSFHCYLSVKMLHPHMHHLIIFMLSLPPVFRHPRFLYMTLEIDETVSRCLCSAHWVSANRMMPVCGVEQLVEEIKYVFGCVVLSLRLMAHVYSVSCRCERLRDIIGWNGCRSEAQWRIAVDSGEGSSKTSVTVLMSWKKHSVFEGLRQAVHQKHEWYDR